MTNSCYAGSCGCATTSLRLYLEDGRTNPAVDLGPLTKHLHAAYGHWVGRNYHQRDFVCAVEHTAAVLFGEFLVAGAELPCKTAPEPTLAPSSRPAKQPQTAALRFYDELSSINPSVKTEELETVLAALFQNWLVQGLHSRDFITAAKDCASGIVYGHQLAASLGGLGGGRDAAAFLSEP